MDEEDLTCLYSNPEPQYFKLLEKKGLNLEKCCKCNGNGDMRDCPYKFDVPFKYKNMRLDEQLYLYNHYNGLLIHVKSSSSPSASP